jgi:hypothetical protein
MRSIRCFPERRQGPNKRVFFSFRSCLEVAERAKEETLTKAIGNDAKTSGFSS